MQSLRAVTSHATSALLPSLTAHRSLRAAGNVVNLFICLPDADLYMSAASAGLLNECASLMLRDWIKPELSTSKSGSPDA